MRRLSLPACARSSQTAIRPGAADPARPFDFLIDGELLRLSLLKHLHAKQISTVSGAQQLASPVPCPAVLSPLSWKHIWFVNRAIWWPGILSVL
jgi:hypothetical protein